jgi:hypothetical protein
MLAKSPIKKEGDYTARAMNGSKLGRHSVQSKNSKLIWITSCRTTTITPIRENAMRK